MKLRRVVITGLGLFHRLGQPRRAAEIPARGENAARKIDAFNVEDLARKIASSIDDAAFGFQPETLCLRRRFQGSNVSFILAPLQLRRLRVQSLMVE